MAALFLCNIALSLALIPLVFEGTLLALSLVVTGRNRRA
jgi:hypothetical protein